jgi:hypothetical protein
MNYHSDSLFDKFNRETAERLSTELSSQTHQIVRSEVMFIGLGYVQEHLSYITYTNNKHTVYYSIK